MKDKRHYLSACSINDEFIYAFGGFFGSTEQEINDSIEMYEVEKNIWTVLTVRMKVKQYYTNRWKEHILNLLFIDVFRTLFGLAVLFLSVQVR